MMKMTRVMATGFLLLGLSACNTDDNAAYEALNPGENQNEVGVHRGDNLGDAFRMKDGRHTAEGFDTNGDFFERVNNRSNWHERGNRRNANNDFTGNMDDSISSDFTTISSGKYPHTRAVQIQAAKYGYIVMDPQKGNQQIRISLPNMNQAATQRYVQQFQNQTTRPGQQAQPGQTQQQPRPQVQQPTQQPTQQARPQQQTQIAQPKPAAQPQQQQAQPAQPKPAAQATQGISATEQKVIELTNVERRKNGLKDLIGDSKLSSVARTKSNDMKTKGYFSHTSPTYGSPFDMMRDFGVTYKTAGENIAQGQPTPEAVVQAWMNSEGHRKNILNGSFTHIGVGHNSSGHYWTQMFIGK
jgi:uncharacterized YkwD family protein